jgi:hypothetical protein
MRTQTNASPSSTMSLIFENIFMTSLPLSENHFEKRLCALTSISCPYEYLRVSGGGGEGVAPVAQADAEFLREGLAEGGLARPGGAVQEDDAPKVRGGAGGGGGDRFQETSVWSTPRSAKSIALVE